MLLPEECRQELIEWLGLNTNWLFIESRSNDVEVDPSGPVVSMPRGYLDNYHRPGIWRAVFEPAFVDEGHPLPLFRKAVFFKNSGQSCQLLARPLYKNRPQLYLRFWSRQACGVTALADSEASLDRLVENYAAYLIGVSG